MASTSDTLSTVPTTTPVNDGFVAEPNISDDRSLSWQKQVLIPSDEPFTHAFLGPLPNPLLETDEINEIFPSHPRLYPNFFSENSYHLECLDPKVRVFRSAPRTEKIDDYIAWLNKVEAQKSAFWKKQGIFDLIQLSRYGPKYDSLLILAAMQFWDVATHSLHLKCGMLSPTLLDIAAITGLKPIGETFDPKLPNQHDFTFDNTSFSAFILDHHNTETEEVSDLEHIAFLTLWLSIYVLCSRSIQIAKTPVNLATQLHEGRQINLAKLILGTLHQQLDVAVLEMKSEPTSKFLVSGPIWLFQLWLLATFELRLNLVIPEAIRPTLENRRIEGIRLAQLQSDQANMSIEDTFSFYFETFLKCYTFTDSMAPFLHRTHGPTWFKRKFPAISEAHAKETNQIWQAYLSPSILSTRLSASGHANNLGISKYFPSYFARQFGLCQLRPTPLCLHRKEFSSPKDEKNYKMVFERFRYRDLIFEPFPFNPRLSSTKAFHDWWLEYYNRALKGRTDANLMEQLITSFPPTTKEKSRGTYLVEIQYCAPSIDFLPNFN